MTRHQTERRLALAALLLIAALLGVLALLSEPDSAEVALAETNEPAAAAPAVLVAEDESAPTVETGPAREVAAPEVSSREETIPEGLQVRVIDGSERAIGGAFVWVWNPGNWGMRDNFRAGTTDLDGLVTFEGLEAGGVHVVVRQESLPGALVAPEKVISDLPETGGRRVTLVCPEPASVHGRVSDGAGEPIAHARVSILGPDDRRVVLTDVDGLYEEGGLYPGNYTVVVAVYASEYLLWAGRTQPELQSRLLLSGERTRIDLQCRVDGKSLRGRVHDSSGRAVEGVLIRLERVTRNKLTGEEGGGHDIGHAVTDADGAWSLVGLPDRVHVIVGDRNMSADLRRDHVLLAESQSEIVTAAGQTLEHTVLVRADGVRYRLKVLPDDGMLARGMSARNLVVEVESGFRISADAEGNVLFSAAAKDRPLRCTVTDGSKLAYRFQLPAVAGSLVERTFVWNGAQ